MIWDMNTDMTNDKKGGRLLEALHGKAAEVCAHVPLDRVKQADGFEFLLDILDKAAGITTNADIRKKVKGSIYDNTRNKFRNWLDFCIACENGFKELEEKKMDLPCLFKASVVLELANLTDNQLQMLT